MRKEARMMTMAIGIIGGADGPTAVYVTPGTWVPAAAVLLAVFITAFVVIRKRIKKK